MATLLVTPAPLATASLTRSRSRRKGPILSPFLREIHLALTLVPIWFLGGDGRVYVILNSQNRDAASHPPPSYPPSIQPLLAAPRPRRASSVTAAAPSPSWFWALDVVPRARSCPPPSRRPCGTPPRCGLPPPPRRGQPAAGCDRDTALLRLPHGEVETTSATCVEWKHLPRCITPFHIPPSKLNPP